ncbi:hypothetical protein [uncultured Anaerococcus sp.]|uniref:hypothetical protein n=1 Tax=uncultured Anaerococcus sp. TaxID=293428 RepID=UPI00288B0A21|nr:hypothetical protein [uncultured Anaerococcus sp.]
MHEPTIKEVNQVFIDQGTAVAILIFLVFLLVIYFGLKIWSIKKQEEATQRRTDEDRAFERKQKEEDRRLSQEKDDKFLASQEKSTEALQQLLREVITAVESSRIYTEKFEDQLKEHSEDSHVSLEALNSSIHELKSMMEMALNTQDDLVKKEMLEDLEKKIDDLYKEIKKD